MRPIHIYIFSWPSSLYFQQIMIISTINIVAAPSDPARVSDRVRVSPMLSSSGGVGNTGPVAETECVAFYVFAVDTCHYTFHYDYNIKTWS